MANRVLSGLGWTSASSLARNVVSLLQITILTRILDKSDFGIIAIATMFITFTTMFLDMGISVGIMYKQDISKKVYSSLFWLNILTGVVLTSVLLIISPLLTASYHSDDLTAIVQILSFTIIVNSIGSQQRTICQKEFRFKRLAIVEIVSALITFGVAFATAEMGFGAYSLAYSSVAGNLFNNLAFLLLGLFGNHKLSIHFNFQETLPFLKIGVYQIGSAIMDFFSRELDIIIISATLGLDFLGVYSIAKKIPIIVYGFVNPILTKVVTPMFAKINDNINCLKQNYLLVTKCISWYAFPMYFIIAALAPTEMQIVFGEQFVDGAVVLSIFAVQYAFNSVNTVCGSLQTALGRTDIGFYWTIYRIVATAGVLFVTSLFGLTIFLWGMVALIIMNIFVCWYMQFRPMVHVNIREYLKAFETPFVISGVLCTIIAIAYYKVSLPYSIGSGVIFILLYVLLMFISKEKLYLQSVCTHLGINIPSILRKYI